MFFTGLFTYKSRGIENKVTLFSSGFQEATIIESVKYHHWCVAHPYHKISTFTLLYWSLFIGVQTVLDTDDIKCCFTELKNHLNHDIIHTDMKNTTITHINAKNVFKAHFHDFELVFLIDFTFLCDDKFEDLNVFFVIVSYEKTIKIIMMITIHLMKEFYL